MLCGLEFVVSLADCTYPVLHDLSVVVWVVLWVVDRRMFGLQASVSILLVGS